MVNTIDKHISALLFHHDIVVVPDFGAFITRHYPAEINTATHMLRPPSKRVAFNGRIKDNDGVLARYISQVEGMEYSKAMESIAISVRSWQRILRSGKKVNLEGVGKLFLDDSSNVQFNPGLDVNYNVHSYGLSIFRSQAVKRDIEVNQNIKKAIEKQQRGGESSKQSIKKEKPRRRSSWSNWAAVIGPVAALALAGYLFFDNIESQLKNVAGLSPIPMMVDSTPSKAAKKSTKAKSAEETSPDRSEKTASYSQEKDNAVSPSQSAEEPKNNTVKSSSINSVAIVVGSFGIEENAQNYARKLGDEFNPSVEPHPNRKMYRVVVNPAVQTSEAEALNRVRQQINAQAWIKSN